MDTDSLTVYIKREITENTDIQKMLKQWKVKGKIKWKMN